MKKLLSLSLMLSLGLATVTPALNAAQSQAVAQSQKNPAHASGWQAAKKWWRAGRNMKALNRQEQRAFDALKKKFAIGIIIAAIIAAIIEGGAALAIGYKKRQEEHTPLATAVWHGNLPAMNQLLATGADINAQGMWGATPLTVAADRGRLPVVERLLAAGADVNARDGRGRTPLAIAVEGDEQSIVERLLAAGADANAAIYDTAHYGYTPLIFAAETNSQDITKLLLDAGANVNAQDGRGRTPLTISVTETIIDRDLVKLLLPYASDENRANAVRVARENGHINVAEMIENFKSGRLTKAARLP